MNTITVWFLIQIFLGVVVGYCVAQEEKSRFWFILVRSVVTVLVVSGIFGTWLIWKQYGFPIAMLGFAGIFFWSLISFGTTTIFERRARRSATHMTET